MRLMGKRIKTHNWPIVSTCLLPTKFKQLTHVNSLAGRHFKRRLLHAHIQTKMCLPPTRKRTVANSEPTIAAYLRIKFPEEVNKSAMKKTCSVLNTGQRFPPLPDANIKTQVVQNISPGSKRPQASGPSSSLTTTTTRVNSRDAATMLQEKIGAINWLPDC